MAHVVTAPCKGCKYTDCVLVCPTESFREGESMLYIDPECCIDCEACTSECPVSAIYQEEQVPKPWREYIELNATMARSCPVIAEKK